MTKNDESHHVIICLASNYRAEEQLAAAREKLAIVLGGMTATSERWSEPYGVSHGPLYLNQLVQGVTRLEEGQLEGRLKTMEMELGRVRDGSGIVAIDLDILQYDDRRLHLRDWEREYVKNLMNEL